MIVGIDLGTSNSGVAIWRDGRPILIPNSLGEVLTPSAVCVEKDGTILVGMPAQDRVVSNPQSSATSFKRLMGTGVITKLREHRFLPEDLSALILRSLKADAETFLGEPVTEAVITVPAYFNDKQRKATRRAGELAGLKVERLVNEPTAAALAYGMHQLDSNVRFLVFDLGGGTFDVSLLEIFEGTIEVRASTGDNRLGGEDFNEVMIDHVYERFKQEWSAARKDDFPQLYQIVREQCERARRTLSLESSGKISIAWKGKLYETEIDQSTFATLAEPLIKRLRNPVLQALRDSQIGIESINEVVLAGGATRMPLVRQTVTRMFGRFPPTNLNPDEVVALGAAVQAGLKMRNADLKEVVLTDVCPYSLGVDMSERKSDGSMNDGIFSPIIERNTVIPASRSNVFSTLADLQTLVRFNIYQGESRIAKQNILLGTIEIAVPARPAGEVTVECRFTYDINGLLEVDVRVPLTGSSRQVIILGEDAFSEPEALAKRRGELASLKIPPRETAENVAALARAHRVYEQFLGERRGLIGRLASEFESALDRQEPRAIEQARKTLHERLDQIEGERYL